MEQGDTEREINAHDPVLSRTWEESVQDICDHAQYPIHVEYCDSTNRQWDVAHAKERETSVADEEDGGREQKTSPCYDNGNVSEAESICVVSEGHVVLEYEGHRRRIVGTSIKAIINFSRQRPGARRR